MSNQDMTQFLGIFLDEGREQLALLESSFLNLERIENGDEILQDLFRAAHTLKGSSRAMGFSALGELTHRMEDVLDALRHGKLTVSPEVVSLMLRCVDSLNELMDAVTATGTDTVTDQLSFEGLLESLSSLLSQEAKLVLPSSPCASEEMLIEVTLDPDCQMKSVRALIVLSVLEELGSILKVDPPREQLEEDMFGFKFKILCKNEIPPIELLSKLKNIPEVAGVQSLQDQGAENASVPKEVGTNRETVTTAQTIRVPVGRLDTLLNLVGELVTDRTQIANIANLLRERYRGDDLVAQLQEATARVARVTGELQDEIMKTRMLPIDNVFQRMPRVVRDLAQNTGKQVDLKISGGDTEIDRSLIDAISDPLIHLLRNCVDHGVETADVRCSRGKSPVGQVSMDARHEENHIVIEISDDGAGIDPDRIKRNAVENRILSEATAESLSDAEAIKLIFAAGLSTAKEISAISGRGVGMDIVKTNLEKIGGRILVESKVCEGTRFTIYLPLTLAIMRALLVEAQNVTYALPLSCVVETLRLGSEESDVKRETISGQSAMVLRGQTVPLTHLQRMLFRSGDSYRTNNISSDSCVVVVGAGASQVGLCVDELKGEQEVVIKPLGGLLGDVHGISGASILGDGSVALIVDPAKALAARAA